ncbi:UDP-N-acetylmuramate--L-alanine ligase [Aggregatilinea lenta]|uniref:UDP-N-acetylmuramate--L-alanine ligase n=1 Tax=Aggregatilinea lenta TaxID=913108 RepID=UPI000E5C4506|nr:UDP-N-acetylmuramate--L-alanine ligase [Aggregatilinea lenta]
MLHSGQHIHIIGIGGFGMSAIARVLLQQGYVVSGSDLHTNDLTRELAASGVTVYEGHAADNVRGADVVAISSAVPDSNPEAAEARAQGLPVLRRRDLLGALMADRVGIAVAGTHGKTTTTALLAHTLIEAGRDPTYIVGGVMQNTGTNAGVGAGPEFVIEADEYDRMFLGLRPKIAVVTNVEHDHPDCYPTWGEMAAAFEAFVHLLPQDGLLVVCADDEPAFALGKERWRTGGPVSSYGTGTASGDWTATEVDPDPAGGMRFNVRRGGQFGSVVGNVHLALDGQHNVQNALAVVAVASHLGVPFETIAAAFASFQGTRRRGEAMGQAGGVTVISDYAHHPTAIRVTLEAHRQRPGVRDLWAVWQPHTYGRLRALATDFTWCFSRADHVLVTDVYSVREQVSPGLDARGMADLIRRTDHPDARYTGAFGATAETLAREVQPGDVVLILSAGDAPEIGRRLLATLAAGSGEALR